MPDTNVKFGADPQGLWSSALYRLQGGAEKQKATSAKKERVHNILHMTTWWGKSITDKPLLRGALVKHSPLATINNEVSTN
ncbi:hypothetical protein HS7_06780 [Sulfolobales archaeon HS-7]|nr:hypothetical protein HS7_06780 [Sulfolobales archaeon HS-7]